MTRFLFAFALAAAPAAAGAHAFLDHAVPGVGATISATPEQVELFFTQELEPAFSGATIAAADGHTIATSAAMVDAHNRAELVLRLPPLAPGTYKVNWHVVSVDTHRTEGSFSFAVRP